MFQQLSLSNFYKKTALKLIYSGHKDEVEESGESHLVTSFLLSQCNRSDMEFVKKFTPPDFQAKNCTLSISPNFNSFSGKNTKNE